MDVLDIVLDVAQLILSVVLIVCIAADIKERKAGK